MPSSSDSPSKHGLFSSLSLGRSSRQPKQTSETLQHPLLGASTSSLNLPSASSEHDGMATGAAVHGRRESASGPSSGSKPVTGLDLSSLPYKPRHKPGHGHSGSASSGPSVPGPNPAAGSPSTSPTTSSVVPTSPATPSSVAARATTSTSTSTTFALPPTALTSDGNDALDLTGSVGSSSTATSRLQLQSIKAAAQRIGLGNGSMGMAMVDTIFERSLTGGVKGKAADNAEWSDLIKILNGGKAALLLPTASASSSLPITMDNIRDHVAFIGPRLPSSNVGETARQDAGTVIITLSGLVGTIKDSTVFFESARTPEAVSTLLTLGGLANLRPAHYSSPSAQTHFPLYALSSQSASLRFPPASEKTISSSLSGDESKSPGKFGRINPFASFFNSSSNPASATTPEKSSSKTHQNSSFENEGDQDDAARLSVEPPGTETASMKSADDTVEGYSVQAYTISKAIRYNDIAKSALKATKSIIKDELSGLPDKSVDKVIKLVLPIMFPATSGAEDKADGTDAIRLELTDPTSTSEKLQHFIEKIYDDLIIHFRADSSHIFSENSQTGSRLRQKASWTRKSSTTEKAWGEDESEAAKSKRKQKARKDKEEMVEREATAGANKVEGVICRLLHNWLFSPAESDDNRHDVVLASRIAALNMLELTLDHLGLDTRPNDLPKEDRDRITNGLGDVTIGVSRELAKLALPSCISPGEKADVLVAAHKVVVDGLAALPAIKLRPEGEPYQPRPPTPEDVPAEQSPGVTQPLSKPQSAVPDRPTETPAAPIMTRTFSSRSRSMSSTPLSTSPATSDPLQSIGQVTGEPEPSIAEDSVTTDIPRVVLSESSQQEEIGQAMHDSVIDLRSRSASSASLQQDQDIAETPKKKDTSSASGADLILPIIIFAVVKSNPPCLASQLMYMRRYRSAICLTGEASYAIVNLTAAIDFIEHVPLSDLGLGEDSDKVVSVDELSPIGLNDLETANADNASIATASSRLRGRVFQVGEFAGSAADSANKVLTGVVDSSRSAIRGFINSSPAPPAEAQLPTPPNNHLEAGSASASTSNGGAAITNGTDNRSRHNSASAFSLSSVTASVAGIAAAATNRNRSRANSRTSALEPNGVPTGPGWKGNEEMTEVVSSSSKPGSIREGGLRFDTNNHDELMVKSDDEDTASGPKRQERRRSDARSIQSVSSVLSRERDEARAREEKERVSLSDRLAQIGGLGKTAGADSTSPDSKSGYMPTVNLSTGRSTPPTVTGSSHARKMSLLSREAASPAGSLSSLPALSESADPPIERFMTCEVGEIRLHEIGTLLRDYRRLGAIINELNAKGRPV